jgi:hypothetical protein
VFKFISCTISLATPIQRTPERFNITVPAVEQGINGQFDVIVSYNVIHTTESVRKSVSNLKSSLTSDGILFVIESAKNETWATLAWGLLDGWWFFKDYDLQPADPMLNPETWEMVLAQDRFGTVLTCPKDNNERSHVEKFMFICTQRMINKTKINAKKEWWETNCYEFDPFANNKITNEDPILKLTYS